MVEEENKPKVKFKELLYFEMVSSLEIFKKTNTWTFLLAILMFFSAIAKFYLLALIFLIAILFLQFRQDARSSEIVAFFRDKNNIPSAGDIKRMKEQEKKAQLLKPTNESQISNETKDAR